MNKTFNFPICLRFVNVLVYYGLSLNISDFGMNIYLTQMIFGLVEMPARTITLFTLNRSRKISQLAFLAVGGSACLMTIFIPKGVDACVPPPHEVDSYCKPNRDTNTRLPLPCCSSVIISVWWKRCTDSSLTSPLELSVIKTVLAMIGKFGITASLSIIYVYSAEVFPTVIR